MDNLLLNLETEFFFLTGVYLEGISGLVFGILIFSLLLSAIRYEKKQELPAITSDISNEIGDERIAKINLSRSLIEMGQEKEAKRLLDELLQDNPTQEEKRLVSNLFKKINSCILHNNYWRYSHAFNLESVDSNRICSGIDGARRYVSTTGTRGLCIIKYARI